MTRILTLAFIPVLAIIVMFIAASPAESAGTPITCYEDEVRTVHGGCKAIDDPQIQWGNCESLTKCSLSTQTQPGESFADAARRMHRYMANVRLKTGGVVVPNGQWQGASNCSSSSFATETAGHYMVTYGGNINIHADLPTGSWVYVRTSSC